MTEEGKSRELEFARRVGEILEKYRDAAGMSRQAVVNELEVKNQYLFNIERNGAKIPLYYFFRIMAMLPVDAAYSMLSETLDLVGIPLCTEKDAALEKIERIAAILAE